MKDKQTWIDRIVELEVALGLYNPDFSMFEYEGVTIDELKERYYYLQERNDKIAE